MSQNLRRRTLTSGKLTSGSWKAATARERERLIFEDLRDAIMKAFAERRASPSSPGPASRIYGFAKVRGFTGADEQWLIRAEAAKYLTRNGYPITPKTLANWASLKKEPHGIKLGKKLVYSRSNLDKFLKCQEAQGRGRHRRVLRAQDHGGPVRADD
jgi:hypothetical protein